MFQSSPACFVCIWVIWSSELRWYENMQGSSAQLHLSHDACDLFRQSIQVLSGRKSPILAQFSLLLLLYISVCVFFFHKSYSVTHWCVIDNKRRSKLHRNKIFLLTCWNLSKVRSRDDFNWPDIPQNWPFYTTSTTMQEMKRLCRWPIFIQQL